MLLRLFLLGLFSFALIGCSGDAAPTDDAPTYGDDYEADMSENAGPEGGSSSKPPESAAPEGAGSDTK